VRPGERQGSDQRQAALPLAEGAGDEDGSRRRAAVADHDPDPVRPPGEPGGDLPARLAAGRVHDRVGGQLTGDGLDVVARRARRQLVTHPAPHVPDVLRPTGEGLGQDYRRNGLGRLPVAIHLADLRITHFKRHFRASSFRSFSVSRAEIISCRAYSGEKMSRAFATAR
jgi:hypothetical protein